MPKQIFISHAHGDKDLAKSIANLLSTGLNITRKDIFCTSLKGSDIPGGEDFLTYIHTELKQAKVIILLLTENYFASQFCIAESGASWVLKEVDKCKVIPIVVPPISRSKLKATLAVSQCRNISDSSEWDDTKDELEDYTGADTATAQWSEEKEVFLNNLDELIKALPSPKIIDPIEHKKLLESVDYLRAQKSTHEEELKEKDSLIQQLSKAKNSEEVRQIKIDNMTEYEAFTSLGSELKQRLSDLPYIMDSAIFHRQRGEDLPEPIFGYSDTEDKWQDIHEAEKKKMLQGEPPLSVNDEHPKIQKVLAALENLVTHMNEHESTLRPILEEEYECTYDLGDEDFWGNATNY